MLWTGDEIYHFPLGTTHACNSKRMSEMEEINKKKWETRGPFHEEKERTHDMATCMPSMLWTGE